MQYLSRIKTCNQNRFQSAGKIFLSDVARRASGGTCTGVQALGVYQRTLFNDLKCVF